ncbi:hypothetical protein [Goodfellowiella coeruleoviolacea]|uniref:Uncharacterized protein n=1 Tax=Goodfellowiella coeruleoviolacea TaxID=334858 RepID=A0AAE3KLP0_9PSEU|nr:hypothetical protein [Goodfellowiella coeruleoviolacea]MCP2166748.1 hypothetical protein [Goodfellowiella coeruleoviolacea]
MSESDDEDEGAEFEVSEEAHTICHLCGGAGFIANPVQAVIGDVPRTIDNGRPCPACDQDGFLVGLVPPV